MKKLYFVLGIFTGCILMALININGFVVGILATIFILIVFYLIKKWFNGEFDKAEKEYPLYDVPNKFQIKKEK